MYNAPVHLHCSRASLPAERGAERSPRRVTEAGGTGMNKTEELEGGWDGESALDYYCESGQVS